MLATFDLDKDGKLSIEEMALIPNDAEEKMTVEEAKVWLQDFDINEDGYIEGIEVLVFFKYMEGKY